MTPPALSPRIESALRPKSSIDLDDDALTVVEVDWVDRRYRDALKAGALPIAAPHDDVGMGAWRRAARLHDPDARCDILIWSSRG
ncbi:MAG: hypothetical protein KDA20_07185 [Phycisphaerales bacterium]|nr:hypothetical protein [Phycisphaerales bacterium]